MRLEIVRIDDPRHPDLAPYVTLRRRKDLERQARFVAEGAKIVERLLASPYAVESLLATEEGLERVRPVLEARAGAVRVFLARDREQLEAVVGFRSQGVKAVGRIPRPATLEDALGAAARPRLFAALDGIANAENVGVVARNAAALGVQALVVGETSCSPFLTRAIGTSMGAVFTIPIVERTPLGEALGRLRAAGVRCVAAHPAASRTLPDVDFRRDCCVVLGSEGHGLSPQVLEACDEAASVPMAEGIDSLNVGSAAAAFFYEAWRQRAT